MQHPQMLHEKFDQFQIWANNTQNVATRDNTSQEGGQMRATCRAQQCCVEMFQSFCRGYIIVSGAEFTGYQ